MLGLSQRYWTLEGLKSSAVLVVIMRVCGGHQAGGEGMSDLAESERMTFLLGNGFINNLYYFVISLQSSTDHCKPTIPDGAVPSANPAGPSLES